MARRDPWEFTRSPTIAGRGSCSSGVAVIMLERWGAQPSAGRGFASRPLTRSAIARMWSGVVPQQPPTIETP